MKKTLILLVLPMLLWACYKDEGNYTYTEINEVEIQGIEDLIQCDQMDRITIPVTLVGTQYSDTSRFTYLWEVNQREVSTEKDLDVFATFPLGLNSARFVVTDKDLGTKAFRHFQINVSSSTASDGILVLSKYQGRAELSFKRLDREGSVFTPNYYQNLTGHSLGTEPRKIHRNYLPEAGNANSGLKIETDRQIRCLDENSLVEIAGNKLMDHNFFIARATSLPPDVNHFDVQALLHVPTSAIPTAFSIGGYICVIANDRLWHDQRMAVPAFGADMNVTYMDKPSPWGGKLSNVIFMPFLKPSGAQDWSMGDYVYLFDETQGQFFYGNVNSAAATAGCPELGTFAGARLVYGTHTASANYSVAVLKEASACRMLYLSLPGSGGEVSKYPFTTVANVQAPADVVTENTVYYPMKNENYMFFATGGNLYYYNLRELESGQAPGAKDVVKRLTDLGYDAQAQITCMNVSRTEQEILLGVSRYGADTQAQGEELKGDVVVLNLQTLELIAKYEGVAGHPVDIMVKYQNFLRDGKSNGSTVSDVLYF